MIARESKEIDVMELHEKWGDIWGMPSGENAGRLAR